jgi:hypothetical protein
VSIALKSAGPKSLEQSVAQSKSGEKRRSLIDGYEVAQFDNLNSALLRRTNQDKQWISSDVYDV